ncbi:MAG: MarR family winged helix-turn-helix transcriptional regulator [Gemmatimonadales bacterium]|jgi:DNA-binding MarR family transcriptional regulator
MPTPAASICAAGTLRRATRSVARLYDGHLARAGLTTTQFSLLVALERRREPTPLTELAAEQVFERTSLYRALTPLEREGLVAFTAGEGRSKEVHLTAKGTRRVAEARPHWQNAQDAFLAQFGRSAWGGLAKQLAAIVDLARDLPAATD